MRGRPAQPATNSSPPIPLPQIPLPNPALLTSASVPRCDRDRLRSAVAGTPPLSVLLIAAVSCSVPLPSVGS